MASSPLLASFPMIPCSLEQSSLFSPCPPPALFSTHPPTKSCSTQQQPAPGSVDDLALPLKSGAGPNIVEYQIARGSISQGLHQFVGGAQGQDDDEDLMESVPMDTLSPTHGEPLASSRSIRSLLPCTPSPNPRGNTTQENHTHNPVPPSHPFANLTATPPIPPSTPPYHMDLSPASIVHSSHPANWPVGAPTGAHYHCQSLCEDNPKLSIPLVEAQVGDMDLDSPSYNKHLTLNGTESGAPLASESLSISTSLLKQHFGRSASEGSPGKRNRMEEDEDYQNPSSSPTSRRSLSRHRISYQTIFKSVRAGLSPSLQYSGDSNLPTNPNFHLFSPEPMSSSSIEDASPCLNAVTRKALYPAPSASPLSAFRFPVTKPTINGDKRQSISRKARSSTGSSKSDSVPSRSRSKVAQSAATLFNRHLSLSTCLDITRLEEPANPRSTSGSEVDEQENSEDPVEERSGFNVSPVPLILVKKTSSAITNAKGKRCAEPLVLDYLQPPPFNPSSALQSPNTRLGFTFGATIRSPVGIAFSEKERAGKILPCHKVSSDGLMRISPETMDKLIEGVYDEKISSKMIIDCRFGYEYDGGHIREAINFHDREAAETMLLQGGIFEGGQNDVPIPSESGKPDPNGETKKVVLVFHCEYSAMRAPTMAKYLREQDRHMNMIHYPALHYPEVYILEGGFAKYFSHSPHHCNGTYVRMDDPTYRSDRQTDLNMFRTRESVFTRTRSYTYGENKISKHKKDSKLTLGLLKSRFGQEKKAGVIGSEMNENSPDHRGHIMEEDDELDNENYEQASSPLCMTNTAATHARRANLKVQGRSLSMLAKLEHGQQPHPIAEPRKPFGSKTLINRLALA